MPVPAIQNAHVIVDANFIISAAEFQAQNAFRQHPAARAFGVAMADLECFLGCMCHGTADGRLHTSQEVLDEFLPHKGRLGTLCRNDRGHYEAARQCIKRCVRVEPVSQSAIGDVLLVPNLPRKLIGQPGRPRSPTEVSDQDLSLVALALDRSRQFQLVLIVTGDQGLMTLVSHIRKQTAWCVAGQEVYPRRVQALHGLHYAENIHRNCGLTSEIFKAFLGFCFANDWNRREHIEPGKCRAVGEQLWEVMESFVESYRQKTLMAVGRAT